MRASVYVTTVRVDLVSVDDKVYQEPSRDLAHVVHATLRMYGCPWEAIRIRIQLYPHNLGERDVNGNISLHMDCVSAPYFLEIYNKKMLQALFRG